MANLKNRSLKKSLSEKAVNNASVTKGTSSEQTVLKKGVPNDHSPKHLSKDAPIVGVSIGSTINMENYESLRLDVWLTDKVASDETIESAYERVAGIVSETLQKLADTYM